MKKIIRVIGTILAVSMSAVGVCGCNFGNHSEPVKKITVTFTADYGGSIDGSTLQIINEGESTEIVIAVPDDGYEFDCWEYIQNGTTCYLQDAEITVSSNDWYGFREAQYVAVFNKITYNAEYSCIDGNEYGTLRYNAYDGLRSSYKLSFQVSIDSDFSAPEITAVPKKDYSRFVKWSDGITTATRHDTDIDGDINITAQFVRIYKVYFIAGNGGSIIGDTYQTIDEGQSTSEVTAVPDDGYEFLYWKHTRYGMDSYYETPSITIDSKDFPSQNIGSFTYNAVFKRK